MVWLPSSEPNVEGGKRINDSPQMHSIDTAVRNRRQPLPGSSRVFRLLTIEPNVEDSELINCSTQIYSIGSAPPYRALSYTWGGDDL